MSDTRMPSVRKVSVIIVINVVIVVVLFFLAEGFSSSMLIGRKAFFNDLIAERRHTQYDEEIGWIHLPNLSLENMYGSKSLITNSMSFRNDKDFSLSVPNNKVRLICSGDSFTMGYGVGNDDVWCRQLEWIDSRIETVNLGQGGYGADQAYLWYKRNSDKLEHNIHIFAFITGDFLRMQSDTFCGYGKPFLVLQDDVLVNVNKPVPKHTYNIPRLPEILRQLGQLNLVKLYQKIRPETEPSLAEDNENQKEYQTREVVIRIFKNLQKIGKTKNSTLVFVYLPMQSDYMSKISEEWRHFLHSEAIKHDFILIDLIDELRKYPPQEVASLFRYDGHYSVKGNSYIANIMYEKLLAIPAIAVKFEEK